MGGGRTLGLILGRREQWGDACLQYWFYFSLSFVHKLKPSPQVESGFPKTVMGEGSLPAPIWAPEHFLSSVQLREAVIERLWWVPGIQTSKTDTTTPWTAIHWLLKVSDRLLNAWNTRQRDALKKRPVGISAQWSRKKQFQLKRLNCKCAEHSVQEDAHGKDKQSICNQNNNFKNSGQSYRSDHPQKSSNFPWEESDQHVLRSKYCY